MENPTNNPIPPRAKPFEASLFFGASKAYFWLTLCLNQAFESDAWDGDALDQGQGDRKGAAFPRLAFQMDFTLH
jgi:hypothetical protein